MRLKDTEATHRRLYKAHWAILAAADNIHAAIVELNDAGRHQDDRRHLSPPLAELEKARDLLDAAIRAAGDGRTSLITTTGCDGTCHDRA